MLTEGALDLMLETGLLVDPLPPWEDEWIIRSNLPTRR